MTPIEQAVSAVGGQAALAKLIGVTPQAVNQWVKERGAPADRCLAIETATGISRYELRPDVFGMEAA